VLIRPIDAHIYHLRRILHNWQEDECRKILKNIADAMAWDSFLLIGEMIIPEKAGVNKYVYMMDICMLIMYVQISTLNCISMYDSSHAAEAISLLRNFQC
jgi:hypothetical protein